MIYKVIGIMSGSSLDGLDIAFAEFIETGGKWNFDIIHAECIAYTKDMEDKLRNTTSLTAQDYLLLHTAYGHYIGKEVIAFINRYGLEHKVNLIASHGHTSFHLPQHQMTAQLGDGAAIAAETKLPVVSDLRAMDVALGGQGAPIVPIGEKLLFAGYDYFLNIGGIANISVNSNGQYIAYDICAANRVLNMLCAEIKLAYDDGGKIAATGIVNEQLLDAINSLDYFSKPYPKSLSNSFGTGIVFPLIKSAGVSLQDALRTYVEHIAVQIKNAIPFNDEPKKMLVTGGGALNLFLTDRLRDLLSPMKAEVVVPDEKIIQYKEAVIMALIGILRWREEENVLSSVTGAARNSVGGALWIGH